MDKQLYNFYANDKFAYFSDHVKVPDKNRGKMAKMALHGWKQKALHSEKLLISKERQVGVTELIAAEIAYNLNFKSNYDMVYMALNLSMVDYTRDKIIRHFSCIPDNIRIGNVAKKNRHEFGTTNYSNISLSGENNCTGRSRSCNAIYMEEVDSFHDFQDCYHSLMPCFMPHNGDTKLVITTTPLSPHSYFNTLWNDITRGFETLELTLKNSILPIDKKRKTLNDITKTAYSKIIRECVIS